jgi:hypothetical protein
VVVVVVAGMVVVVDEVEVVAIVVVGATSVVDVDVPPRAEHAVTTNAIAPSKPRCTNRP